MTLPWSGRLRVVRIVFRTYGIRGLIRRGVHEFRRRSNRFRTSPRSARAVPKAGAHYRYAPVGDWGQLSASDRQGILHRGDRVMAGQYQAYGDAWLTLPSGSDQWHGHPQQDFAFDTGPWWRLGLMPTGIDIKDVWEPGRFAWVYDLVRAYALSGDIEYSDAFYRIAGDWAESNPAFSGPHWACGQETAIRALALLHGLDSLPASLECQPARLVLQQQLGWSGERIADAIGYGLSQRNNHGISESAGLVHLGLRLRGAHPHAQRWLSNGAGWLEEQILDQFSPDGWYAQHSFIYLRVALDQALLAQRVLLAADLSLSDQALLRLRAALRLVGLLVDPESGEMPNHGANDGARVLPLSTAEYRDFRPLLTLGAIVEGSGIAGGIRPDPQTTCWLGDALPPAGPRRADGLARGDSGWVVGRLGQTSIFMFAGHYRHRPGHLDVLHVHLRMNGREIVADPGTFSYNAPAPWKNGLASATVHNGPLIDGREPAQRGPGFLWLDWPDAHIVHAEHQADGIRIVAERPGAVRRELQLTEQRLEVFDRCLDSSADTIEVNWLLPPDVADRVLVESEGAQYVAASETAIAGWYSPTYGQRRASRQVRVVRDIETGGDVIQTSIAYRESAQAGEHDSVGAV